MRAPALALLALRALVCARARELRAGVAGAPLAAPPPRAPSAAPRRGSAGAAAVAPRGAAPQARGRGALLAAEAAVGGGAVGAAGAQLEGLAAVGLWHVGAVGVPCGLLCCLLCGAWCCVPLGLTGTGCSLVVTCLVIAYVVLDTSIISMLLRGRPTGFWCTVLGAWALAQLVLLGCIAAIGCCSGATAFWWLSSGLSKLRQHEGSEEARAGRPWARAEAPTIPGVPVAAGRAPLPRVG